MRPYFSSGVISLLIFSGLAGCGQPQAQSVERPNLRAQPEAGGNSVGSGVVEPESPTPCLLNEPIIFDANAWQLFAIAEACALKEDTESLTLALILGQIRASADMSVLQPVDEQATMEAAELYGQIFYVYGGAGSSELWRDVARSAELVAKIEAADLGLAETYDPGWTFDKRARRDLYSEVVDYHRRHRLWQLDYYARLVRNDSYYEAQQELDALESENGTFEVGTPAYEKYQELMAVKNEASAAIEELPPPQSDISFEVLDVQAADRADRQLHNGVNGPAEAGATLYRTEAELRNSWIADALTPTELSVLVSQVDFATEHVVSAALGRRTNAAGPPDFAEIGFYSTFGSYSVSTRLGVIPKECGEEQTESYPFAIGKVEAVAEAVIAASGTSNYPVGCGPVMSSKPTEE